MDEHGNAGDSEHTFYRMAPGEVSDLRVRGWVCDQCTKTHIVVYVKCVPPSEYSEDDTYYGAFDMTADAAQTLMTEIPIELANPALGIDGGSHMDMAPF